MIRVVTFVIMTCILVFCDLNDGMNKIQLYVIGLIFLTIAAHCGAVEVNPLETLIILSFTLWPVYNQWARRFKTEDIIKAKAMEMQKRNSS